MLDLLTGLFRRTSNGGSFQPSADYDITGSWNFQAPFGFRQRLFSPPGAVFALPKSLSGACLLFDRVGGTTFQLPAPEPGLCFEFLSTVTLTGGVMEIQTGRANVFLQGTVLSGLVNITPSAGGGPKYFISPGTANTKFSMNGSTTGGLRGTRVRALCVSSTFWQIDSVIVGTGAIDTPFLP